MRANIAHLGATLTGLFILVVIALTYWQLVAADSLNSMGSNPRLAEAEQRMLRGAILDRNGQSLAETQPSDEGNRRVYPLRSASAVTGYYSLRYGRSGLEARYDDELRGTSVGGAAQELRQRLFHTTIVGSDILTTVDARIQEAAAQALGDQRGAVVALDPRTGEVLALVSTPSFDAGDVEGQFAALREHADAPLFNRAIQSSYVPGSTFKLVTATAAIDRGLVELDQPFTCTTAIDLGGQPVDCRNSIHLPQLTYKQAFAWSSNRTFALSGLLLGVPGPINPWLDDNPPGDYPWENGTIDESARALEDYASRFGFGAEIPFDLSVQPSRLRGENSRWELGLLAGTSFGQGELLATPLQMALVAAAVANDGRVPRPYLVSSVRAPNGEERTIGEPGGWIGEVARAESAQVLREFMVEGVESGYAEQARIEGVSVGGKTGTAEVGGDQTPHAWFIGFAPADNPRVAIAVVFEHGGSGSDVASPAAGQILRVALDVYTPQGR